MTTAIEEMRALLPKPPKAGTPDAALYHILADNPGAWVDLREAGASDEDIRECMVDLIGPEGRTRSQHGICHIKCGTQVCAVWFRTFGVGEPSLEGQALVDRVREVFQIPFLEAAPERKDRPRPRAADSLPDIEPPEQQEPVEQESVGQEPVEDLSLAPNDPQGRDWRSLSSEELQTAFGWCCEAEPDRKYLPYIIAAMDERDGGEYVAPTLALAPVQGESLQGESLQAELFDYSVLDQKTADAVKEEAREINLLVRRSTEDMKEIGRRLIETKAKLKGHFQAWTRGEFGWSERSARNFMSVYLKFGAANIAGLAQTAAYALAGESVPESARQDALDRTDRGEKITAKKAAEIIEKHRPPGEKKRYEQTRIDDFTGGAAIDLAPAEEVTAKEGAAQETAAGEEVPEHIRQLREVIDIESPDAIEPEVITAPKTEVGDKRTCSHCGCTPESPCMGAGGHPRCEWSNDPEQAECSRCAPKEEPAKGAETAAAPVEAAPVESESSEREKPAREVRPAIEELLGDRMLVITYTYLPGIASLAGKVSVGVRVGGDPLKAETVSIDSSKVRHTSEEVLELVTRQIEAAKRNGSKKPAARKASAKKTPTKKAVTGSKVAAGKAGSRKGTATRVSTKKR